MARELITNHEPINETTTNNETKYFTKDDISILSVEQAKWANLVRFQPIVVSVNVPDKLEGNGNQVSCEVIIEEYTLISNITFVEGFKGTYEIKSLAYGAVVGYWGLPMKDSYEIVFCCEDVCTSKTVSVIQYQ